MLSRLRHGLTSDEEQYLNLVRDILEHGEEVEGRNGSTKVVVGAAMRFDLSDGKLPLVTTKRLAWKTCLRELLWFVSGSTDNESLLRAGVKIWKQNASREALDGRGLTHLEEGDLGPVYGHQWRHFNAPYGTRHDDYTGKGVDQLANAIRMLQDPRDRYSRRIVITAWNPEQIDEMALPPCHMTMQFNVVGERLYCDLYQRSGDVGLGVPFNIASYSFLTHLVAHHCGLVPAALNYHLSNAHIYHDHEQAMREQASRSCLATPTLSVLTRRDSIEDYCEADFEVRAYEHHPAVQMNMSV